MHGIFKDLNREYEIIRFNSIVDLLQIHIERTADYCIANWPHVAAELDDSTNSSLIFDEPDNDVVQYIHSDMEPIEWWENEPYILYTGNYAEYQGVDLLLDAFRLLDENVRLVLTGNPPDDYHVDEDSIISAGYVDELTLARLLKYADVLVSPRRTDGFPPMKVLYYLLTYNPIVSTDRTCHTSILQGVPGVIFCDETPSSFAKGLQMSLEDEGSYEREHSQKNVATKYEKVYKEVME